MSRLSTTIAEIDETERRAAEKGEAAERRPTEKEEQAEERAFCDFILGRSHELRAGEQNLSMGNNSAIIPTTIVKSHNQSRIRQMPDFCRATRYNVKVNLKIPKWGICVVNRYDPKRLEKIKDMVLQRICAVGVEP